MAVRRNYRINLRNYGNPPAIMVSQYDENYDLVFEVYDGVVPATGLNAYTVKLVGRQPGDDPALKYEFTGAVSGIANNVLSFTIDTTMTGRAGKGTAEIVILDTTNDVKFASFNLPVYVEKATVPDGSIDADVQRAMEIAEEVQEIVDTAAAEVKGEAEAWAVGQRDGVDVPSTDPAYENNAKYYAEQAQDIADSIGIDATLSVSGKAADAKKTGDEIGALKEDLSRIEDEIIDYNSVNSLAISGAFNNTTANGVTYTWVSKTECHVEGTATGYAFCNIFASLSALPKGMIPGKTVKVIFDTEQPISLEIIAYLNNQSSGGVSTIFRNTGNYTVPVDCTGMSIRMRSRSTDPANGSIFIGIITAESNSELSASVSVLENKVTTAENDISDLNTKNAIINSTSNTNTTGIYEIFENDLIEWTAGKQVNSNGSIGDNANTCAFSKYMYCPAGSKLSVSDGYLFNIAVYTAPISSAMTYYRGFNNVPYFVTSDCYVNVSVANVTSGVPVTVENAKNAFNGVIILQVKAEEYKAEIQNIVNLNAVELESGTLNIAGTPEDATNRMRSATGVFIKSGTTLINTTGVSVNWRSYSDKECTKFYAAGGSFVTGNVAISRDNYYKFVLQKNNYLNGRLSQYFAINDNNVQEDHDERLASLEFSVQPLRGMSIIFPPSAPYAYSGADITEAIINGSGNLLTPLYNLYDALETAYPNHITKEVLGLDQSGQYEIRAYTIQQHKVPISKPAILWISGVHASETYTHTATYAFVKELLENHENNDVLGFIWRNCIFKVIPIGNPWGLANGASRYNSRGVNLNRNFNADWEYSTDEYNNSGSAPESEAETQIIVNFVKANNGAIFAVNKHDSGTDLSGSGRVAYSVDDFRIDTNILRSVYAQMQMAILKKYTWIAQNRPAVEYTMMFNSLSTAEDHGTMDKWFSTVGVHGCLLEVSRPATTGYTADKKQDFIQMNLETSVNMISAVIEKNQLMASNDKLWYTYNVMELT